ncbi:putative polysaccharide biosynthesis protein [Candidatus Contubernalis alkaliaceticus]|uniref:putative polysaccharide biosynthesis protein n=1 Tax=Candidatus Contubernalis alkaliaceticus TaxID=338645 RepID=UPI001F4C09FC|nr:polysaccharide biosynthesis protein [Candidatus Contubernalis alkalaceticus]UNC93145.1 polysaccharide biosynthesis protein [Candidatus Contubernalis alkalaceticus]
MYKKKLIQGTIILTGASLITRILGLANRMVLSRLIGAEGLGLFQMALPYYMLMTVVANLSMPGAMSRIISNRMAQGDKAGVEQVRRISLYLVIVTSVLSAAALWLGAPLLACYFLPDPRVELMFKAMSPALLFIGPSSAIKGYFQGLNNMTPSAVSLIVEQFFRVGASISGAYMLLPRGLEAAVLGSVTGYALGEACCFAVMRWYDKSRYIPFIYRPRATNSATLRELFYFALPLVMIRFSGSISSSIAAFLIPARLIQAGFTTAQATSLFGKLMGMALPLLFLPTVAIMPLSTTLVPTITSAVSLHNRQLTKRLINFAFSLTFLLGGITSVIFFLFPEQLVNLFYNTPAVAPLVVGMAPAVPFAYTQFTGLAILNAIGLPRQAFFTDIISNIAFLTLVFFLVGNPQLGIQGAVWALNISFFFGAIVVLVLIYYGIKKL